MFPYGRMALYTLYVYIERINLYVLYDYIKHMNSYVLYSYINLYVYITAINSLKQCLRHNQTGIAILFISIAFPAHIIITHYARLQGCYAPQAATSLQSAIRDYSICAKSK